MPTKNTSLEKLVRFEVRRSGFSFKTHCKSLPGCPDIVFPALKKVIFVDGDFWHGYRYPTWKRKIKAAFWRKKIEANRRRDRRNFQKLRRLGWSVLRIWGHEIRNQRAKASRKIYDFLRE